MAHPYSVGRNDEDSLELDNRNALVYNALMKADGSKLVQHYCLQRQQYPEGPMHVVTIHRDTVLHMAAHTANADLVIQLVEMLAVNEHFKLAHQNAAGNTVLHEAAAFDKLVPAAKRLVEKAPWLLSMHNCFGETALFNAARYGQIEMFAFLHSRVQQQMRDRNVEDSEIEGKKFYQRHNRSTVLHMAVILGHFDLALTIGMECECLVAEEDEHGMTALQHLACNSGAFKMRKSGFLKRFIYHWVLRLPLCEATSKKKLKYESAKKLASFLVAKDNTTWKETFSLEAHQTNETQQNGGPSVSKSSSTNNIDVEVEIDGTKRNTDTPLFLAIKSGCVDIVEMILKLYPQAVEHVDGNGSTILHVAVKYRQLWVCDVLRRVGIPWRRLIVQRDRDLNTILHMVGEDCMQEVEQGNAIVQLQSDLFLFKKVKEICSSCSVDTSLYRNREGKTAKEAFVKNKEELRAKAVEWTKFMIESSTWLGVFVAAVAFAAVYTLPGGLHQETGVPMFLSKPFFLIFIMTDILCFSFYCISSALFITVLNSPFRFKDFYLSIPARLVLGVKFNLYGVTMLALAFASAIVLIVQKMDQWKRIGFYTIGFVPYTVLSVVFVQVYMYFTRAALSLFITPVKGPPYRSFSFRSCIAHLLWFRKFMPPPSSNSSTRV